MSDIRFDPKKSADVKWENVRFESVIPALYISHTRTEPRITNELSAFLRGLLIGSSLTASVTAIILIVTGH